MAEDIIALLTRIANEAGIPPSIFIAIARWESGLDPNVSHDQGQGWGLFGCHFDGRGAGYTAEQLKDPELNARLSAQELGRVWRESKAAGMSDAQAIRALWIEGQRPRRNTAEDVARVENAIQYTIQQAGVPAEEPTTTMGAAGSPLGGLKPQVTTPAATSVGGTLPEPRLEDFQQEGYTDWEGYYRAMTAYQTALQGPMVTEELRRSLLEEEEGEDFSALFDDILNLWGTQIAGGQLDVQKADVELGKRLDALTQGRTMYESLVGQALPEGAKYIPGGEPGGVYERIGLGVQPAATQRINPFAIAMSMMGETPEMGATPTMTFEEAIALAQQLQAAAGGGTTTPGMTVGAGATAPITAAGTITPERQVEPSGGWQTPSREVEPAGGWQTPAPSTTPSATAAPTAPTPKFGYGAIPEETAPEVAAPNFAEIISRMTEKELEVLRLILAAMSGGRPSPVPVPSPPSTFSQALAR